MRNILFTPEAWADFEYWLDKDPEKAERIRDLIKECMRTPFTGTGKPEPLKHELSGYWSRRITHADRMVYSADKYNLTVIALRYHYK